ncbi:FadR/GntR family transcriptional regulator [Rugosimonospora africana]|uniref:FadR/GntR family transcriptional regulator n=1 Tax=Rugosimonospora africana TaxID=556532 RepID=UPI001943EDFD|nr:FadR/GntR family transcriptional regulator [Rugosimonospora africana]
MRSYPGRGIHGQVVDTLGLRVLGGDYLPGDVIDPDRLESELAVSKTVIREALRVLGAKGLVDSRPKRGTFVRERSSWSLLDTDVMKWQLQVGVSDRFLADLAEVRALVEPACAALAARRHTADDLVALEDAVAAMAAADGDADAAIAADLRFHRALMAAAQNELFTRMDVVITNALDARDRVVHKPGDHWSDPTPNHQAILDRIRDGDVDGSREAVHRLLAQADADLRRARAASPATRTARRRRTQA